MKFYKLEAKTEVIMQSDYPDPHPYAGKIMSPDVDYCIIKELEENNIFCDELDKIEIDSFEVIKDSILFNCAFTSIVNFEFDPSEMEYIMGNNLKKITEI